MLRAPDGHSRIELSRFLTPPIIANHRNAPVNALGSGEANDWGGP